MSNPQGKYDLCITLLPRSLAAQGPNGEEIESWPTPGLVCFAKRDMLTAGETITQGVRQATGGMKLRIRGRMITVSAVDRLMITATSEVFSVTGVWRDRDDTIVLCERAHEQATGQ